MIPFDSAQRIHRFLRRRYRKPWWRWDRVDDPRDRRGRRRPLSQLLEAVRLGLLSCQHGLRDVEMLTQQLRGPARALVSDRVPYTTISDLLAKLMPDGLRQHLVGQLRDMKRAKQLEPDGLPCGVATMDGKCLATLRHDAAGTGQLQRGDDGKQRYLVRAIRTVLSSSASKPCIDQYSVPADTNEMGAFEAAFRQLIATYRRGDYFDVIDVDAGLICRRHAQLIVDEGFGYVARLKQSQPELLAEAERLLEPRIARQTPDAETPWQPYQGNRIRRRLWRTSRIEGWLDFPGLRQAYVVVTQTRHPDETVNTEYHYWITSLGPNTFTPAQLLHAARNHWSIENDCFWSLDVLWREDSHGWCNRGRAAESLGLLRLMAYNLVQFLRKRHVRHKRPRQGDTVDAPWRDVFRWIDRALTSDFADIAPKQAAVAPGI